MFEACFPSLGNPSTMVALQLSGFESWPLHPVPLLSHAASLNMTSTAIEQPAQGYQETMQDTTRK